MSKMRRWCCVIGHRGDLPRIRGAHCSMRKLKLLVLSNIRRDAPRLNGQNRRGRDTDG
jgi:hypothetical protein